MVKFGIITQQQYLRLDQRQRRFSGAHVAYNLLGVGEQPSAEQIRVFEDVSFTLLTSNGTFRTTFRNRFEDVDRVALRWLGKLHSVWILAPRSGSRRLTRIDVQGIR